MYVDEVKVELNAGFTDMVQDPICITSCMKRHWSRHNVVCGVYGDWPADLAGLC